MQAVILAGGNTAQLHPWTPGIPKPLLPFFDRPVTEHIIRLLARHDIRDIIITTSYLAKDMIRYFGDGSRWGVSIRYSVESEPMGTAGAVKLVQEMISDTFVVISSDIVTDLDISAALQSHKSAGSIATILLHEVEDPSRFGVVGCEDSGKVSRFVEKPRSSEAFANTISTGIYILEPEALSSISHFEAQDFARHLFPLLLRNQEPVHSSRLPGYWCDLGDLLQYRNAHFDALQGKIRLDLPAIYIGEGIWVGDGVDMHPSVQLASPIFIGSGASIGRNAVIGAHTIVGANAQIDEGAYVARSVICGGATVGRETTVADTVIAGGYTVVESEDKQAATPKRSDRSRSSKRSSTQELIA